MNKIINIKDKYSVEMSDIVNKLNQLENNRIYELTNCKCDGSLRTNIYELKQMLADLFDKIENKHDSILK